MISIILNVYNGEKYIKRCVESVLSQTYQNFELLIIDDGSTDSTAKIIDSYPSSFVNVKVFHTENKGLSGSRRYGLSKVSGEFLIFIDCDDWVEPNWLESLISNLQKQNADLAICNYFEDYSGHSSHIEVCKREQISDYVSDLMHGRTWCVVWNKLVKTEIIRKNGIDFFEHLRYWEDVPFSVSYALYCNRIAFVQQPLYHYVKTNEESLTATDKHQISFNECRVKAVRMIEKHLKLSGKSQIYESDLLWLKFWIKNEFILHTVSKERVELWRISFPEMNKVWRKFTGKFILKYWALEHGINWYVLLNGKYWQFRHQIKAILKLNRKR